MKDEIKEILDYFRKYMTIDDCIRLNKIEDYITNLQKRIKELEQINEEHCRINGELRKTINEAIDYNEKVLKENWYGGNEKENATKTINILQGDNKGE